MAKVSDARSAARAPLPTPFEFMSVFWNGYMTLLDMQRQTFGAPGLLRPSLRNVEIGEAEHVIPVPREELQVGKRQVVSEKAFRVRTVVKEVPVEQSLDLRSERVVIERRPSTSTPNGDGFHESIIEVQEMHEEPVVSKVVRQGEEFVIHKAVETHRTTIRDVIREVHVEVDGEVDHGRTERDAKRREIAMLHAAADKPEQARSRKSVKSDDKD
jgi:hypothetical protein